MGSTWTGISDRPDLKSGLLAYILETAVLYTGAPSYWEA